MDLENKINKVIENNIGKKITIYAINYNVILSGQRVDLSQFNVKDKNH